MKVTVIQAVAVLLAAPALVVGDGCHTSGDSIGNYCKFFGNSWRAAADRWCTKFAGTKVGVGHSFNHYNTHQPDGAGGHQSFWGNYRVDRGGTHTITKGGCLDHMAAIKADCGGYGGWRNTPWGTVFGECIRE